MEHHNGWCPQRTFHEACPWIHHLPPSFSIIMSFAPRDKIISKIKDVPPFCISAFEFSSSSVSSVAQSCPTLCDPMNRSTPGLPVHHQLPEFTQTHVHRVSDAIQPSHSLFSPSPPAPSPSQHQSLFQWVNSSHEMTKVQEFQLQHHSFQRNPRADLLQNGLVGSPCSPRDSQESSPTLSSSYFHPNPIWLDISKPFWKLSRLCLFSFSLYFICKQPWPMTFLDQSCQPWDSAIYTFY